MIAAVSSRARDRLAARHALLIACAASRKTYRTRGRRVRDAQAARPSTSAKASSCRSSVRRGCGKSTLLKLVAGLLPHQRRPIELAGQPVNGPRARRRHRVPEPRAAGLAHGARQHHAADRDAQAAAASRGSRARAQLIAMVGLDGLREQASRGSSRAACSSAPRSAARWCTTRRSC